jgi:hypothetical protein
MARRLPRLAPDADVEGGFDVRTVDRAALDDGCGQDGAGIDADMDDYGFCIPIDRDVEALANRALQTPGSFYAFGRIGILLLIPGERRIIDAYNG